jgi:hypothetical protein
MEKWINIVVQAAPQHSDYLRTEQVVVTPRKAVLKEMQEGHPAK